MINLLTAPLRRPLVPVILFLAMAILGIHAFMQLKVANMPAVDEPNIVIVVSLPGATPSQIEASVVTKMEDALATLDSIQHIYSNIRPGSAYLNASFSLNRQTREALADVRDAVGRLRGSLPPGTAEPVVRVENLSRLLLTYVVEPSASLDVIDATSLTDNTVVKALASVP
jgi:multidrug efflux pump subunit AcrB